MLCSTPVEYWHQRMIDGWQLHGGCLQRRGVGMGGVTCRWWSTAGMKGWNLCSDKRATAAAAAAGQWRTDDDDDDAWSKWAGVCIEPLTCTYYPVWPLDKPWCGSSIAYTSKYSNNITMYFGKIPAVCYIYIISLLIGAYCMHHDIFNDVILLYMNSVVIVIFIRLMFMHSAESIHPYRTHGLKIYK